MNELTTRIQGAYKEVGELATRVFANIAHSKITPEELLKIEGEGVEFLRKAVEKIDTLKDKL